MTNFRLLSKLRKWILRHPLNVDVRQRWAMGGAYEPCKVDIAMATVHLHDRRPLTELVERAEAGEIFPEEQAMHLLRVDGETLDKMNDPEAWPEGLRKAYQSLMIDQPRVANRLLADYIGDIMKQLTPKAA